jgi:hypothetical protein
MAAAMGPPITATEGSVSVALHCHPNARHLLSNQRIQTIYSRSVRSANSWLVHVNGGLQSLGSRPKPVSHAKRVAFTQDDNLPTLSSSMSLTRMECASSSSSGALVKASENWPESNADSREANHVAETPGTTVVKNLSGKIPGPKLSNHGSVQETQKIPSSARRARVPHPTLQPPGVPGTL